MVVMVLGLGIFARAFFEERSPPVGFGMFGMAWGRQGVHSFRAGSH